ADPGDARVVAQFLRLVPFLPSHRIHLKMFRQPFLRIGNHRAELPDRENATGLPQPLLVIEGPAAIQAYQECQGTDQWHSHWSGNDDRGQVKDALDDRIEPESPLLSNCNLGRRYRRIWRLKTIKHKTPSRHRSSDARAKLCCYSTGYCLNSEAKFTLH